MLFPPFHNALLFGGAIPTIINRCLPELCLITILAIFEKILILDNSGDEISIYDITNIDLKPQVTVRNH